MDHCQLVAVSSLEMRSSILFMYVCANYNNYAVILYTEKFLIVSRDAIYENGMNHSDLLADNT